MTSAIDLTGVSKQYGKRVLALNDVSLRVDRGEIFGLLGPNGAGKSTLVKILMSVIRPTKASGTVLGDAVGTKSTLSRVGFLPESHRFPRYLTGRQVVEFSGALAGIARPQRKHRAAELLEQLGMTEWADQKITRYSKGMAQRIGLAQAMVNNPELILLDEPTDGVDPMARRTIRGVLSELKAKGTTVFINSHLLSDLEMVCDRVAILVAGRVAKQGTVQELALDKSRYEIDLAPDASLTPQRLEQILGTPLRMETRADPNNGSAMPILVGSYDGVWVEAQPRQLRVGHTDPARIWPLVDSLRAAGLQVTRLQAVRPGLEELFIDAMNAVGATVKAGAKR